MGRDENRKCVRHHFPDRLKGELCGFRFVVFRKFLAVRPAVLHEFISGVFQSILPICPLRTQEVSYVGAQRVSDVEGDHALTVPSGNRLGDAGRVQATGISASLRLRLSCVYY